MVGVLADKPKEVNYIALEKNSTYFYFDQNTIPTDYRALDAIDILIINRFDIVSSKIDKDIKIMLMSDMHNREISERIVKAISEEKVKMVVEANQKYN